MGKNLYIATMESRSGKSVVLLGLMELLSRRIQKIGIFRPIVTAGEKHDDYLELVSKRYTRSMPIATWNNRLFYGYRALMYRLRPGINVKRLHDSESQRAGLGPAP